jgi:hypothetical protein
VAKEAGDAVSAQDRRLLADLAAQAGLVLELRATAQRLVAAGDAARRGWSGTCTTARSSVW